MNSLQKRIISLVIAILMLIPSTTAFSASAEKISGDASYALLQDIIDIYLEKSLYETDRETLINDMLYNYLQQNPYLIGPLANALLSSNDPYSSYYSSNVGFMSTTSKSYGVIVADAALLEDESLSEGAYIKEVIPGSNAEFAGIRAGDRFLSIEGINVEGLTVDGITKLLSFLPFAPKNKEDSKYFKEFSTEGYDPERYNEYKVLEWDFTKEVSMVFERTLSDGSKCNVDISVAKGISQVKDISLDLDKEASTAVITFSSFSSETVADRFFEAFDEAYNAGCKNLIIDLRDNPGGYFDAAQNIGSRFTNGKKTMFHISYRNTEDPEPVMSTGESYIGDKFEKYIVLVNQNTASAAELLAYILKTQAGATVIGKTTFGKALAQEAYSVYNGDSFTITVFEILTAEKESYNGIGIIPDLEVDLSPEKYDFPEGMSHFNHTNFVEIGDGKKNEPTLALEQRMYLLGLLRESAVDGLYDDATKACIMIYKSIQMDEESPDGTVTYDMVTSVTDYINTLKNKYVFIDSQMNVAKLYIQNKSQGKRLAAEYARELEKYKKYKAEIEERNYQEYLESTESENGQATDDTE